MNNKRSIDRSLSAESLKLSLKTGFDKIAGDAASQSSNPELANDLFIGLLFVRIMEESLHWQKSVGVIAELWAGYKQYCGSSGFHNLIREYAHKFKTGDKLTPDLNLVDRFAYAVEQLSLSDPTWAYLIEDLIYKYRIDCNQSSENDESIGPDTLAWTNEYVSKWSNQKSSGVFYTSKKEACLVAQLALGYWIDVQLAKYGADERLAPGRTILPELLTGSPTDLKVIDTRALRQLNESLCQITIIDPACGCGTLLIEMFRLLMAVIEKISSAVGIPFHKEKIGRSIIERSLFGFDTDSRGLAIAEARLWLCLTESCGDIAERRIRTNLAEKDCLIEPEIATNEDQVNRNPRTSKFDIVIGNPPFVRHEIINSPGIERESYTRKLRHAIKKIWPDISINGRADLHTFFFYLGVSMLKPNGVICYISPNAWLDVDYGEQLRNFLVGHTNLRVLLNPARRRFSAGVNTLIVVASTPDADKRPSKEPVVFITPGQTMKDTDILSVAFNPRSESSDNFRVIAKDALQTIAGGINGRQADHSNGHRQMLATGSRWSTYFRAPDIYFDLSRKLGGRLKPLGSIGKVRYPLKTGINEFFFLTSEQVLERSIEKEYLMPVVKSTKEFSSYSLGPESKVYLFCCDRSLSELRTLKHTGALNYIKWGNGQSTKSGISWPKVPLVAGRKHWYAVPRLDRHILCNRFFDRRFFFGYSIRSVIEDQTFYGLTLHGGKRRHLLQAALLNSTLSYLFVELFGRVSLGEGVLQYAKYEMDLLPALDARELSANDGREILNAFMPLTKRNIKPIFEEIVQDDRREFDLLISSKIGLTKSSVKELSSALIELVRLRLDKAASAPF